MLPATLLVAACDCFRCDSRPAPDGLGGSQARGEVRTAPPHRVADQRDGALVVERTRFDTEVSTRAGCRSLPTRPPLFEVGKGSFVRNWKKADTEARPQCSARRSPRLYPCEAITKDALVVLGPQRPCASRLGKLLFRFGAVGGVDTGVPPEPVLAADVFCTS